MLSDYIYGPVMYPYVCFDARFAERYGVTEAIVFNHLYHDFLVEVQMKTSSGWARDDGWIKEAGRWWRMHTTDSLLNEWHNFIDAQQVKVAIEHLCKEKVLYVRPSMTNGYWWVAIGEEENKDDERQANRNH